MQGIRFYLEHASASDKRKNKHEGNVFAQFTDVRPYLSGRIPVCEGLGSLFDRPNSPVCTTAYSLELLRKKCKRISETKARKIHLELFRVLDAAE